MPEEIDARYAQYSTAELFELARGGESRFRPEAWSALKEELRKRGMELTPEDEALASGASDDAIITDPELPIPAGLDGWLVLFVMMMAVNVIILTYRTLASFVALAWVGVLYGLNDVVLVIGLVLIYHRDPLAPRFWRGVLVLLAAVNLCLVAAHLMSPLSAVLGVAVPIAWAVYWHHSPRVRATFSARASAVGARARDTERMPNDDDIDTELDLARRQGNAAALWILSGLIITIGTYSVASSRGRGEYFVAWGAILYGIIHGARASARRSRARARLAKLSS